MPNNVQVVPPQRPIIQVEFPKPQIIEVSHQGPTGPQGPTGSTGSAGAHGVEYTQNTPAATWGPYNTPVGLGRKPMVTIYVDNEIVDAPVLWDSGHISIQFPYPVSGYCVLA